MTDTRIEPGGLPLRPLALNEPQTTPCRLRRAPSRPVPTVYVTVQSGHRIFGKCEPKLLVGTDAYDDPSTAPPASDAVLRDVRAKLDFRSVLSKDTHGSSYRLGLIGLHLKQTIAKLSTEQSSYRVEAVPFRLYRERSQNPGMPLMGDMPDPKLKDKGIEESDFDYEPATVPETGGWFII
ncbi:hypothetical protein Q5752_000687 [Cryptotrichosporon argae]